MVIYQHSEVQKNRYSGICVTLGLLSLGRSVQITIQLQFSTVTITLSTFKEIELMHPKWSPKKKIVINEC